MIQFAYATDGTTAAGAGNMTSTIIMIVVMIAIFYFLLIRPENKRKKQAEEMRNSLKKGDWLTTIGGIYGRVVSITDRTPIALSCATPSRASRRGSSRSASNPRTCFDCSSKRTATVLPRLSSFSIALRSSPPSEATWAV